MSKKIFGLALGAMLLALSFPAEAQQPKKVPRIGFLSASFPSSSPSRREAFRQALRDLGYMEGKNLTIEYRYAEGKLERLPDLAGEIVRLKVDVIVTGGTAAALAAKKATGVIPIVMANVGDPVARGLVASLARPGGNLTGTTSVSPDLAGKRLELLKETVPRVTGVGILWDPADQGATANFKDAEDAARGLGLQVQSLEVRSPNDFEVAFKAATGGRIHALVIVQSALTNAHVKRVVEIAAKSRLPSMYGTAEFVDAGGLMSYAPNYAELWRRAAVYVDKILKGTKPADLPVEQPMKFELVINLKTAKQIGLTIPPNVLARADKVIR